MVYIQKRAERSGPIWRVRWVIPETGVTDQEKFPLDEDDRAKTFASLVRLNGERYPTLAQMTAFGFEPPPGFARTAPLPTVGGFDLGQQLAPVGAGVPMVAMGADGVPIWIPPQVPVVEVPQTTIEEACEGFIDTLTRPNKESVRKYRERLRLHVYPSLGPRPVAAVTRGELRDWQSALENKGLASKTIQNTRGDVLSPMFDASCLEGEHGEPPLRRQNPLKGLALPLRVRSPREVLQDQAQVDIFLKAAYTVDPMAAELLVVKLATGMRWGEIAGLPVENVLPDQEILVNQVYRREGNTWEIVPQPKTEAGFRTIPTPRAAWEIAWRRSELRSPGRPVFPAPEGGFWRYSQFYDGRWKKILALAIKMGLRVARFTLHTLRHSLLTRLADEGLELSTLAQIAGHKPGTTYAMYVHPTRRNHRRAREMSSSMLPSEFGGWNVYDDND